MSQGLKLPGARLARHLTGLFHSRRLCQILKDHYERKKPSPMEVSGMFLSPHRNSHSIRLRLRLTCDAVNVCSLPPRGLRDKNARPGVLHGQYR